MMKKKVKVFAMFALAAMMFSVTKPSEAKADYYEFPAYFAADSYVHSSGKWGEAYSANYECVGSNQDVSVSSVMYYRQRSTGTGGSYTRKSKYDIGYGCYAQVYFEAPSSVYSISSIVSTHRGKWNGYALNDYTRD